jgi:dolichol-phosphate mannosyltransferase
MKLSIILPVKKEPYLRYLLNDITHSIEGDIETFVQTEKGLGNAVKCGLQRCSGEYVVIMDSDGSHTPKAIPEMIKHLEDADIVVGSRYVKGGVSYDSFGRRFISKVYCRFAKTLFGLKIKDNMSGFIVAKKEVFDAYPISNKGFKFGLELLVKTKKVYKAIECPIVFEKRKMGKSKANYKEAFHTLFFMLWLKAKVIF